MANRKIICVLAGALLTVTSCGSLTNSSKSNPTTESSFESSMKSSAESSEQSSLESSKESSVESSVESSSAEQTSSSISSSEESSTEDPAITNAKILYKAEINGYESFADIAGLKQQAIADIDAATSVEAITSIYDQFEEDVAAAEKVITDARADAIKQLTDFVTASTVKDKTELNEMVAAYTVSINSKVVVTEIQTVTTEALAALGTKETGLKVAEALAAAKTAALAEIDEYVEGQYNFVQEDADFILLVTAAKKAINDCEKASDLASIVTAQKTILGDKATEITTANSLNLAKAEAISEIEEYANGKGDIANAAQAFKDAVTAAKAAINACTAEADVEGVVTTQKGILDSKAEEAIAADTLKKAQIAAKGELEEYRTTDIEDIFYGSSDISSIISDAKTALDSAVDQTAIDTIVSTAKADIDAKIDELKIIQHVADSTVGTEEGFKDAALVPTGYHAINYIKKPGESVLYHSSIKYVSFDMYLPTGVTTVSAKISYGGNYFEEYKLTASGKDFSSNNSSTWSSWLDYSTYGIVEDSNGKDLKSTGCNGIVGQWVTFTFAINPNNSFSGLAWGNAELSVSGASIYVKNFKYLTEKTNSITKLQALADYYLTDTKHDLDYVIDESSAYNNCIKLSSKATTDTWTGLGFSKVATNKNKPVADANGKFVKVRFNVQEHGEDALAFRIDQNNKTDRCAVIKSDSDFTPNGEQYLFDDDGKEAKRLVAGEWFNYYVKIDNEGHSWGSFYVNGFTLTKTQMTDDNPVITYISSYTFANEDEVNNINVYKATNEIANYKKTEISALICSPDSVNAIINQAKTDIVATPADADSITATAKATVDAELAKLAITQHVNGSTTTTDEGFEDCAKVPTGWNRINKLQSLTEQKLRNPSIKWMSFKMYVPAETTKVEVKIQYGSNYYEDYKIDSGLDFCANNSKDSSKWVNYSNNGFVFDESGNDIKSSKISGLQGKWTTFTFAVNPNNSYNGTGWGIAELSVSGAAIYTKDFQYLTEKPMAVQKAQALNKVNATDSTHVIDFVEDTNSEFVGCVRMTNNGGDNWNGLGVNAIVKAGTTTPVSSANGKVLKFRFYVVAHGDDVLQLRVEHYFKTEVTNNLKTDGDNTSNVKLYDDNGVEVTRFAADTWLTGYITINTENNSWGTFYINAFTSPSTNTTSGNPVISYFSTVELVDSMPA